LENVTVEDITAEADVSLRTFGSAVNDVTRELGGTFAVAVVGAVFLSVYGPRLALLLHGAGLPAPVLAAAKQSPATALEVADRHRRAPRR
jgi:hypothetical protein